MKVTDDIFLELLNKKHAKQLLDLINKNRSHLRQWLSWVDGMTTPDDVDKFIQGANERIVNKTEVSFVIVYNNQLTGRIGLYNIDNANMIASVGYWLDETCQGKGIITKACAVIMAFGFEEPNVNRIEIKCATKNFKSESIPKRLNFTKRGL